MMKEACINMYIVNKSLSVCNLSVLLLALWHVQLAEKYWTAEELGMVEDGARPLLMLFCQTV